MQIETLKSRLHEYEPLFFSTGEPGAWRILEKSGRVSCHVTQNDLPEEQVIADIRSFLSNPPDLEGQWPVRLIIHLPCEVLALDHVVPALVSVAELNAPTGRCGIIIHAGEPLSDWSVIHSFVQAVRDSVKRPRDVWIELVAPFAQFQEQPMESLFNLGLRIRIAAGWTKGCETERPLLVDADVLRGLSEFGFRTVIQWYVHASNITAFREVIPDLLMANYCSGFSLPLVSENIYYQFRPGFPELPGTVDYCQLLVKTYRQYPYYDDVFSPLITLALLIREAGRHSKSNIPSTVQLVVNQEGCISLFRQSPALANPWSTLKEAATTPVTALTNHFLQFLGQWQQLEKVLYCRRCRWRYTCGGLDAAAEILPDSTKDTMCEFRKLFLEHFATMRAPDHVIDGSPRLTAP